MIVEDNNSIADMLSNALENRGYAVVACVDRCGPALVLAGQVGLDLALVDIDLAEGDDGVALATKLHSLDLPVMFISGKADCARAAKAVARASLPKPFSLRNAVLSVDYLLREEEGADLRPKPYGLEVFK